LHFLCKNENNSQAGRKLYWKNFGKRVGKNFSLNIKFLFITLLDLMTSATSPATTAEIFDSIDADKFV